MLNGTGKRIAVVVILVLLLGVIIYLGNQKHFGLPQYIQLALDGIRGGTIYALIALGFVTIFNVTGIINFAQGAFVMLGAMIAVTINDSSLPLSAGPKLVIAVIGAIVVTTLIGILIERLTIYPARNASTITLIIITVGVYIAIQGIALLIWGTDSYALPAFTTLEQKDETIRLGSIIIKAQSFWIWGTTAVVLAGLAYFF